ncbi:MAG: hypothetical protein ACD_72C00390G0003 [uncultured bacterium]|nr:MAG: hypothetical protein ACD_72C00390G0003 [uncultured bacterium]
MFRFFKNLIITVVLFSGVFAFTTPILAANISGEIGDQLSHAGGEKGAGLGAPTDPRLIVVNIIRVALGFTGMLALCLVIYAGYLWMTAGGNEEDVGKAKTLLRQSVIGLAIILTSYSLTTAAISLVLGRPLNYTSGVWIEPQPMLIKGPNDY